MVPVGMMQDRGLLPGADIPQGDQFLTPHGEDRPVGLEAGGRKGSEIRIHGAR